MFVLKNKRMRFSLCRLGRTPGVGLGVAWGQFFFPNMVVWHIKLKGMMSRMGYKLNFHRMVKLVIFFLVNRSIIIKFLRESGVLAMAPHRLCDYKYSHFLRCFKIRRLLFDCSFSFSFTPIDRLWHDACSLDSMERNAYIRACELSQPWIQFDVLIKLRN